MDVRCEQCGTEYEFDQNRVGHQGVTVKCTQCGSVFKVHRPDRRRMLNRPTTTIGNGPEGREWLVRRQDQQMVAFRELTTLQKWIVEGRIGREDEISKNGETWKRLGNIRELEPFFSVFEKAQALNRLVEQGAPIPPTLVRGSDVFRSLHPGAGTHPGQPSSNPAQPLSGVHPRSNPGLVMSNTGSFVSPTSGLENRSANSPIYPVVPPPLPVGPRSGTSPRLSARSADVATATPPPAHLRDARPIHERGPFGPGTGLPGPGALDSDQPPAAFGTNSLDIPEEVLGAELPADMRPAGPQRQHWGLMLALLVFLGIGIGAAFAAYGPQDNPLRALAIRYGIRRAADPTQAIARQLDAAQRALDRDTIQSRRQALATLASLHGQYPSHPKIGPRRAFAAAITARSQQRWISDLADLPGSRTSRTTATQRARAERLLSQAKDWLLAFDRAGSKSREVQLARVALSLARGEPKQAQRVLTAIATSDPTHRGDPVWLHLSAAADAYSDSASAKQLLQAQTRLRTAISVRPTLTRAQILLARIARRRGDTGQAREILKQILERVPGHEEARRLQKVWSARRPAAAPTTVARSRTIEPAPVAQPTPPPPPAPVAEPPPRSRTFAEWMRIGDRLRERDKTEEALDAYGQAGELDPDHADPQIGKGWCLLDLGKLKVALIAFQRARDADNEHPEAYYGLAETYRYLKEKEKALAAYQEYLERAPPDTPERRAVQRMIAQLKGE